MVSYALGLSWVSALVSIFVTQFLLGLAIIVLGFACLASVSGPFRCPRCRKEWPKLPQESPSKYRLPSVGDHCVHCGLRARQPVFTG